VKLYLVTRSDLPPGARAAQLCHALRAYQHEHPVEERAWFEQSNTLVLLETSSETELLRLVHRARENHVSVSLFYEPDLGNAATALALGPEGRRFVRQLPLALAS